MHLRARFYTVLTALGVVAMLLTACVPGAPASSGPTSAPAAATSDGASARQPAAPSSAGQTDPKSISGEITVWYFDRDSMDVAISRFREQYPNVEVNFVHQPFGDMTKKYQAALAARSGVPDVIGLDTSMVGRFLDAGEDLLAAPYNAGQYRDDFVEWKFNAPIVDGKMTAFPWDVATGVMFYRTDVFEQAGLPTDPEQVAASLRTWDDYIKAGQQIRAKTNGQAAIVANAKDIFNVAYWQNGGNIVRDGKIALIREGLDPLQLAARANQARITPDPIIATWSERWAPALQSGQVGTVMMGAWMLGTLQNQFDPDGAGKWRIAPAPGGAFNHGGTYVQIPQFAQNKAAAWEFVKFLTTNAEVQNAVFQKTGIVPAYKPAWQSPIYDEPVPYLGGQKAWRLLIDLAQQVKPHAYSAVDALGSDLLNAQVDLALSGRAEPQQALRAAAEQLKERAARAANLELQIDG